ncbi:NACHT, LRR and PYD domains-containing protein 3-like [Hoplias malabaricus]|uniref:NACHT, LRR and PYD domains-containing protein 3-like n=1 Tax=Hoplias malabaricus TaxID=27720 RepID=UPI003461FD39
MADTCVLLDILDDLTIDDLTRFQWHLKNGVQGFPRMRTAELKNAKTHETVDIMVMYLGKRKAVDITLAVLKMMNQNQLAQELRTKFPDGIQRGNFVEKKDIKRFFLEKLENLFDRTSLQDDPLLLKHIYTEVYVTEGCTGGVNTEEASYLKSKATPVKLSVVFSVPSQPKTRGVKVLTVGIAGVGKTASLNKFILDWAKEKSNNDLDFILLLPFQELNVIKDEIYSLLELLEYFHQELCGEDALEFLNGNSRILIILDGLDESKIRLDFNQRKVCKVTERTTLNNLLTNLIKGELLPSALIWITSRPAAVHQIPHQYLHHITEIHGFNDLQKEEYFKKRICDEDQASRIISHIRSTPSLHVMCQTPIFCKILTSVFESMQGCAGVENDLTTLTEIYLHFLIFQMKQNSEKYSTNANDDVVVPAPKRNPRVTILKLGELAFLQLQKRQLIFYEQDLEKCGLGIKETLDSGVCTKIFKRDETMFSFVHFSFQEFLAAVFVYLSFRKGYNPLLQSLLEKIKWKARHNLNDALKNAVKIAIEDENGRLDLFVRFLLGLSVLANQSLMKELQPNLEDSEEDLQDTVDYIKRNVKKTTVEIKKTTVEKSINLFYCLTEMKDNSLTSEIKNYLDSGSLRAQDLTSIQWIAVAFVLVMSKETQEEFDLKKYKPSDEGLRLLFPVVKNTKSALLDYCNLSEDSCKALASGFSSTMKVLDLGYNNLRDSGVEQLCSGLKSSNCKLETLRLPGCLLAEKGCSYLADVLASGFISTLKELDLGNNDLKDSGVEQLCSGLKSSHCKLEILILSGCLVTENGCAFLASALSVNPSYLKVLDLTYNHPGDSGVRLLSARCEDPQSLDTKVEYAGENRIKPGLMKYACKITLDTNTAHTHLRLSEGDRKVEYVKEPQPSPECTERFEDYPQVLSCETLSGRCYWEVEWSDDEVEIAVAYKSILKFGSSSEGRFGNNKMSWSLTYSNNTFSAWHNTKRNKIPGTYINVKRAGLYLDCPAGSLSFYSIFSDTQTLTHLHTFYNAFTEPLFAGLTVAEDSWVRLCMCEVE